jgi:chromosome segregation ATPase
MDVMVGEVKQYRSPTRKLVTFFEKSRDQWKQKCLQAKRRVKLLHTRVADLEVSRRRWKERAQQWQKESHQLREQIEALKNAPGR